MTPIHPGVAFGCDYNPEQWDEAVWREDVELMGRAGVNLVAINIFGWSQLNPRKGEWDFSDLDTVIDLLHTAGIGVNLGTATSSTPAWLTRLHPEVLPVADDGTTRFPGGRQAWCPSSPVYRRYALTLVEAVAERYGAHPAVRLWHVSNELGCHNALCYCGASAAAFRRWLQTRYGSLDALNRAWGTSFWSQRYSDWEDILPPLRTLSSRNPGQVLDFHRFSSDELLDHYRAEAEIIRRHSAAPVSTNFMVTAHIRNLDYWTWAPEMDVIANDHYLDHRLDDPTLELAFAADTTRGLAGGRPWMLMESSTGAVNWQPHNLAKHPGELTRNALTHVARGADAVCFFQWRASLQGSEKFHSALLPHAGTDSAVWREVLELGELLGRLEEVTGTTVTAEVALLFSWESWWAADGENRPSHALGYLDQVHAAYQALRASGVTVDIVRPGSDLTGYRVAVVPGLYLVRAAEARAVADFVAQGGTALVTFFSGIADEDDRVIPGGYPGAFRDMLGLRVEEFAPVTPDTAVTLVSGATAGLWTERLTADAEVLDRFADGPSAGGPALTRNRHGGGEAWYLATLPDAGAYAGIVDRILTAAGVVAPAGAGEDVEVVRRTGPDASYLFVINHGATGLELPVSGHELVTGTPGTVLTVPAGSVRIVREDQR
ncbi:MULTISPECIES: beta-galactosidase [unclassified Leifsonia]|uniref:beta-galactosidase n=1 Tax=unclassified Leifsonia TaxID=2663824 RepID=UPI0008A7C75C|nr:MULTISPECIES: beta-galactosidase [unclassified Leifsonia]SEI14213.1 beta-galactosidase [Leifsonia sp. CL154]SFM00866.1 beta-galactosidase [Leifsonia sp. CL147]